MLRFAKRICWLAVLGLGVQCASAFVPIGPVNEPYQAPVIGYNPNPNIDQLAIGPKNIGEEYRRNTPVLYYSFDANFEGFFGSNGIAAVEEAVAILNALTNVSSYSAQLSEFPLEAHSFNYQALALVLTDVKSTALHFLVEQLGLAEPDRYTWTLHNRDVGPGGCPGDVTYFVIKRNLDPVISPLDQFQYSSYVNGTLYTYGIVEYCTATASPLPPLLADAAEIQVDPLATAFTAVAAGGQGVGGSAQAASGQFLGLFYQGLTRDDVGGLRYLLQTNNMNVEAAGLDTVTFITNNTTFQLLSTSNLTLFASQALTNDAAALNALYPNLIITGTTLIFTNLVTTNQFAFFTNSPYAPLNSPASLVTGTTFTTNVVIWFRHTFANVVTNSVFTNGVITIQTTSTTFPPNAPLGSAPVTNVTVQNLSVPMIMGDFFIIPPGLCDFSIVSTQLVRVLTETNLIVVATNAPGTTNVNQQFSQSLVTYFTNTIFVVHPVECPINSIAKRQGIERVTFVRKVVDPLTGLFYVPVTNTYEVISISTNNGALVRQTIQRVITSPDILFSAQDLTGGPGGTDLTGVARNVPFVTTTALPGLAGPGTIQPGSVITFNKVGPIYLNFSPGFLDELTQFPLLIWGTFDGSTNPPVVYPNGTSIANLESQVLVQITPPPPILPSGSVGVPYSISFAASGGVVSPLQWLLSPQSPGLPPGLSLTSAGALSGTPTAEGTYDIIIRMVDAVGLLLDTRYEITIGP